MCSPFLLVPGQSRSSLESLRSSSYKMASDGAKGSNYAHSFVSVTSSRCEPNTTPFCASTQALVPWSDTKCGQPFRCFIPIETGVTQHLLNGPHELKQRRSRALTAKKCTKKRDARAKLLFCFLAVLVAVAVVV